MFDAPRRPRGVIRVESGGAGWRLLDEMGVLAFEEVPLEVPNQGIAEAIIAEWQGKRQLDPLALQPDRPASQIARLALLGAMRQPEKYVCELRNFLRTDTIVFWQHRPSGLFALQEERWQPVLEWTAARFGTAPEPNFGLETVSVPGRLDQAVGDWLRECDAFTLATLVFLSGISGSLLLGLALALRRLDSESAYAAANLEVLYQCARWGHDAEADARLKRQRQSFVLAGVFFDNHHDDEQGTRTPETTENSSRNPTSS